MKQIIGILILLIGMQLFSSCDGVLFPHRYNNDGYENNQYNNGHRHKKMPPGQAKKIYGDQSARDYAPGHNK